MRIVKLNEIEESKISLGRLAKRLVTEDIGAKNVSTSWISFPPRVETEKHTRENEEILIPLEGKGYIRTEEGDCRGS